MQSAYQSILGDDLGGKLYNGSQLGIGLIALGTGISQLPSKAVSVSGWNVGYESVRNGAQTVTRVSQTGTKINIDTYTTSGLYVKTIAIDLTHVGTGTLVIGMDGYSIYKFDIND